MKTAALPLTLLGSALLLATGCTPWPTKGTGGQAETRSTADYYVSEIGYSRDADTLKRQLQTLNRDLDVLVLRGVRHCIPAAVEDAALLHHRIRRELDGGLNADAYTDLAILNQQLFEMSNQVAYLNAHTQCARPDADEQIAWQTLLARFLASETQFDLDSDELSDAYAARLSDFAGLMKQLPYYQLDIEGHTDQYGSEAANQSLSERRAQRVKDYLISQGIDAQRITSRGHGETLPLLKDNTPDSQTWNRRVEIRLNDTRTQGDLKGQHRAGLALKLWENHFNGKYQPY